MAQSLFGMVDPQSVQQAIQLEQQKNMMAQANMDPAAYLRYSAGLQGQRLGQSVGRLFGMEQTDPRLKQASDAQAAYQEALSITGGDATSPDFFKAFANAAAQRNLGPLAQEAAMQASKLEVEQAKAFRSTATLDPKKQAEAIVLRISQIPEEERTEEDTRQLSAANQLLKRDKEATVQSSKILEDGTTVQVLSNGETVVTDSEGTVLTGAARSAAVKNAQKYGTEIFGQRQQLGAQGRLSQEAAFAPIIAGGKEAGQTAQKIAAKTLEDSDKIEKNINNLQRVLVEIQKGATTGVIAEKFPDWTASTIALRNLQNELGLDIVGATTFGALSEGELRLALDTALPTNLEPPELAKWVRNKIKAQEKLLSYFNQKARYLSKPGRTVNDWLEFVDERNISIRNKPPASADAKRQRLEELRRLKAAGGQR
jgi:hypothetical protein